MVKLPLVVSKTKPPATQIIRSPSSPLALDNDGADGDEHRRFPRAQLAVPFQLWIGEGPARRFSASLRSIDLSVSGAFIASTFFLPLKTELRVSFVLGESEDRVEARAQLVRQDPPDPQSGRPSGFALRFVEFFDQTEVTLAKLFLGEQLRAFAEGYLSSKRARSLDNELDRCIDALAAWELQKVTTATDSWGGNFSP